MLGVINKICFVTYSRGQKQDNGDNKHSPIGQIEEREHQREGYPGYNVYPLGARRELGHPQPAAVLPGRVHVDLALPHLVRATQRFLQLQTSQGTRMGSILYGHAGT